MPRPSSSFPIIPGMSPERLRAPDDLSPAEKRLFVDIVADYKAAHFKSTDAPLIVAYCRAVLDEQEASVRLAEEGQVVDGKLSPWLAVRAQAAKSMLSFSRALRLSPQARGPTPARPDKPQRQLSVYERMALGDDNDAA